MIAKVLQALYFQGLQDYFFAERTKSYYFFICINCESALATSSCLFGYKCEYILRVVSTFSWPSLSEISKGGKPSSISNEACECRYGIITTNRKSLYFQGV